MRITSPGVIARRVRRQSRKYLGSARVEKALTGRYFRHIFREGRVIGRVGGWYEWLVEDGKKQLWYITRKLDAPIFMAGLANFKPYTEQAVEVGLVIITEDSEGGMVESEVAVHLNEKSATEYRNRRY